MIKSEAISLFNSCHVEYGSKSKAAKHIAELLGIGCYETVLIWVRQQDIGVGITTGATTSENFELKGSEEKSQSLKEQMASWKQPQLFSRPSTSGQKQIVAFIDEYCSYREHGGLLWCVEPIYKVLRSEQGRSISPSSYYVFKKRTPSKREINDAHLSEKIMEIYLRNYHCYGVCKMWHTLFNVCGKRTTGLP